MVPLVNFDDAQKIWTTGESHWWLQVLKVVGVLALIIYAWIRGHHTVQTGNRGLILRFGGTRMKKREDQPPRCQACEKRSKFRWRFWPFMAYRCEKCFGHDPHRRCAKHSTLRWRAWPSCIIRCADCSSAQLCRRCEKRFKSKLRFIPLVRYFCDNCKVLMVAIELNPGFCFFVPHMDKVHEESVRERIRKLERQTMKTDTGLIWLFGVVSYRSFDIASTFQESEDPNERVVSIVQEKLRELAEEQLPIGYMKRAIMDDEAVQQALAGYGILLTDLQITVAYPTDPEQLATALERTGLWLKYIPELRNDPKTNGHEHSSNGHSQLEGQLLLPFAHASSNGSSRN